jgi:hypothetical protein
MNLKVLPMPVDSHTYGANASSGQHGQTEIGVTLKEIGSAAI